MKRSDFSIAPYLQRSNAKGIWQILVTLLPVAILWWIVLRIYQSYLPLPIKVLSFFPVLGLLALFSSRIFSLMHDCGHNSLFDSRLLNRSMGFLLGVLNAIPQYPWSRDHAFHHRHNGNWQIYRGPIDVITVEDFQSLSKRSQWLYSLSRHWIMLFPGGFYYLIIKPRLTLVQTILDFLFSISNEFLESIRKKNFRNIFSFSTRIQSKASGYGNTSGEIIDLIANNFLVLISWYLMSKWLGFGLFWICYSIVMTISAAIFICIFFVQHNFEGSYAHSTEDWSSVLGAVEGSSNLDIPIWLNWFFADISYHSIHHLCDRIPNYNLRKCHLKNKHLLKDSMILRLNEIPECFDYILWDSNEQKLTTIAALQNSY